MKEYEDIDSTTTFIIDISSIDNEQVDLRVKFSEDDEYAKIYINGGEWCLSENNKIEAKYLIDKYGLEDGIWFIKNSVHGLYQMGVINHNSENLK